MRVALFTWWVHRKGGAGEVWLPGRKLLAPEKKVHWTTPGLMNFIRLVIYWRGFIFGSYWPVEGQKWNWKYKFKCKWGDSLIYIYHISCGDIQTWICSPIHWHNFFTNNINTCQTLINNHRGQHPWTSYIKLCPLMRCPHMRLQTRRCPIWTKS